MARRPALLRAAAVLLAGMAALALIGALLLWATGTLFGPDTLTSLAGIARRLRPFAMLFWAGVIALAAWRWTALIDWLIERGFVAPFNRATLMSARWRLCALLLLIDLVVIGNLPFGLLGR
jgi:hypothetical protein